MTVKQKAVESLLQGVEDKRAWKDWYRRNACAKHGVQYEEAREVDLSSPPPEPKSKPQVRARPTPQVQTVEPTPWWQGMAGKAAALALVAALTGGGVYYATRPNPADPLPPEDPGVTLYQDIQDQGLHIGG